MPIFFSNIQIGGAFQPTNKVSRDHWLKTQSNLIIVVLGLHFSGILARKTNWKILLQQLVSHTLMYLREIWKHGDRKHAVLIFQRHFGHLCDEKVQQLKPFSHSNMKFRKNVTVLTEVFCHPGHPSENILATRPWAWRRKSNEPT